MMLVAPDTKTAKSNGHGKKLDVENIRVKINVGEMSFGDVRFMNKFRLLGEDDMTPEVFEEMAQFLDRVLDGGVNQYPLKALPQIMEAINKAIMNEREQPTKNSNGRRRRGRGSTPPLP